jgi:ubiquinone/menaquinone biosynthesis C-methylase UbiE
MPASAAAYLKWGIPAALVESPAVEYRNHFAAALSHMTADEIVEAYVYMSCDAMHRLVCAACSAVRFHPRGTGLDLGAGCGLLASTIARFREVEKIYAVEICESMVGRVIPKVAQRVLGTDARKVIGACGSFDDIELPDNSVDFIVEIDSLHHSDDLEQTLRECARVLRPGGQMLCFDRCHPDSVTDSEVERMLSEVYSESFLQKNHYPPGIRLTRRENGEHEFRLREWKAAFSSAGLKLESARKFIRAVRPALALKGCLNVLPRTVTRWLYKSDNADLRTTMQWLFQPLLLLNEDPDFGAPILAPKNTTVFLLTRQVIP